MRIAIPVVEAAFILVLVFGVWLLAGLGVALIVAGLFGVVGCEWASVRAGRVTR